MFSISKVKALLVKMFSITVSHKYSPLQIFEIQGGSRCVFSSLPLHPAEKPSRPPSALLERCKDHIYSNHPTSLYTDVKLSDLQLVLDFMYNGEVKVAKEELNSFLALAEELKVKGLAQSQLNGKQKSSSSTPLAKPASPCLPDKQPSTRRPLPTSVLKPKRLSTPLENDAAQELVFVKSEPFETLPIHQDLGNSVQSTEGDFGTVGDYQENDQYDGKGYGANGGKLFPHILSTGFKT